MRPTRPVDKSQSFLEALHQKYASEFEEEIAKRKAARAEKKVANASWSNKVVKKEEKEKRKEKKDRKRKWLKNQEQEKVDSKYGDNEDGEDEGDDWDELAREERMAKKLKRGNITQSDFDMEFSEL